MYRFIVLFLGVLWLSVGFSAFEHAYFQGLDENLSQAGVPHALLPSQRDVTIQVATNTRRFSLTGCIPRSDPFEPDHTIPGYPGDLHFPKNYLSAFLQHLFPKNELFLAPNQNPLDPVSKLTSMQLGQFIHLLAHAPKKPLPFLYQEVWRILTGKEKIPGKEQKVLDALPLEVFNHQDIVAGLKRSIEKGFISTTERDYYPGQLLTNALMDTRPQLFDFGHINPGELEAINPLKGKDEWVLKKRKFVDIFSKAALETGSQTHAPMIDALTAFFWKKVAKTQEDLDQFYGAILGKPEFKISPDLFSGRFKTEDFKPLEDQVIAEPKTFFSLTDEERYFLVGKLKNRSFIPLGYSECFLKTPSGKPVSFPDCGETALHNFLYHLCTERRETGLTLNPDFLPESPAKSFVQKHPQWEAHLTPEVRTEMGQMIANLPTLVYCKAKDGFRYEIKSGLANYDKILRYLLNMEPGQSIPGSVASFGEIVQVLEEKIPSKVIEFGENPAQSEALGCLTIRDRDTLKELGCLGVYSGHARYMSSDTANVPYISALLQHISSPEEARQASSLLPLADELAIDPLDFSVSIEEQCQKILTPLMDLLFSFPDPYKRQYLYSMVPMTEVEPILIVLKKILAHDRENIPYAIGMLQYLKGLQDRYIWLSFKDELQVFLNNPEISDDLKIQVVEAIELEALNRDSSTPQGGEKNDIVGFSRQNPSWLEDHTFIEPFSQSTLDLQQVEDSSIRDKLLEKFPYTEKAYININSQEGLNFLLPLSKNHLKNVLLIVHINDRKPVWRDGFDRIVGKESEDNLKYNQGLSQEWDKVFKEGLQKFPINIREVSCHWDHSLFPSLAYLKELVDVAAFKKISLNFEVSLNIYLDLLKHISQQGYSFSTLFPDAMKWKKDLSYRLSDGEEIKGESLLPMDMENGPFFQVWDNNVHLVLHNQRNPWFLEKCLEIVGHKKDEALGERAGPAE